MVVKQSTLSSLSLSMANLVLNTIFCAKSLIDRNVFTRLPHLPVYLDKGSLLSSSLMKRYSKRILGNLKRLFNNRRNLKTIE